MMIFGKANMKLEYILSVVGGLFILHHHVVNGQAAEQQGTGRRLPATNPIVRTSEHCKHLGSTQVGRRRLSLGLADLNGTLTATDLVDALLGPDVTSSNVNYVGADRASGTFSGGASIFGIDAGIVLTSGSVANIEGPNLYDDISADNGLAGDADLDEIIAPESSNDATVLEFDFECSGSDNIHFEYVFASDEYNEYVYEGFNDVFAFFLNGVDVALVPGTTMPVSIDNVNCDNPYNTSSPGASNCDKFINNDLDDGGPFVNTEMDGLTQVFQVTAPLQAGVNHIKLAIADATDSIYDSAVLIKEGSFSCIKPDISGDPHIKTWSGAKYDFHGVCDLVLLQNPGFQEGLGMAIHVRTRQLKEFSYVSSAVLQIGDDTLEVMGDIHENLYWINKHAGGDLEKGINGYPISYRKVNSKQHEFTVDLGGNMQIVMKTFKKFVRVTIQGATKESFGTSLGLLGSYGTGKMVARDNNTIIEDANAFGQEWQVLPADGMLFHNEEGPQAPQMCQVPQSSNLRRRLAESTISEEEAEIACARVNPDDFDTCVFDVMATGERDVAGAY